MIAQKENLNKKSNLKKTAKSKEEKKKSVVIQGDQPAQPDPEAYHAEAEALRAAEAEKR